MRKILSTTLAVGILTSFGITPALALDANVLPTVDRVVQNADVTKNGNNMNVQIQGGSGSVGVVQYSDFNVGKDASVNFEFTNQNQTSLNIVNQSGGISQIYGQLTNSGCASCGYQGTGKVMIVNPNGFIFGEGANVNLNSFAATTYDANYDSAQQKLSLTKQANSGDIKVLNGAKIYGDKNVTLAAKNIYTYAGSKISTNILANADKNSAGEYTGAYGRVSLVTSDGVNFTYYNNGGVKTVDGYKGSNDKMVINLNGDIESGHIDVSNMSTDKDSIISITNKANLKATKATRGNDGNIWLTSTERILVDKQSNVETVKGGNIILNANNKVSISEGSKINSTGSLTIKSNTYDIAIDNSTAHGDNGVVIDAKNNIGIQNGSHVGSGKSLHITAGNNAVVDKSKVGSGDGKETIIKAGKVASVQNESGVYSYDVIIEGGERALISNSTVSGGSSGYRGSITLNGKNKATIKDSYLGSYNTNVTGGEVNITNSELSNSENINIASTANDITIDNSSLYAGDSVKENGIPKGGELKINAKGNAKLNNTDVKNSKTSIFAGKDINAKLKNVGIREHGLIAEAENNVTIETDGTLSVGRLVAKNGDMTLTANNIIAGEPKVTNDYLKTPNDSADRAYIYVLNGKFTSNTKSDSYTVTESADPVDPNTEGYFNKRHHIEYGNGNEKILLVNKRPYTPAAVPTEPQVEPQVELPYADDDQAKMLNKIPRQPETFNNNVNINNGRTTLVDVFAAASQIEIEDDEEEE